MRDTMIVIIITLTMSFVHIQMMVRRVRWKLQEMLFSLVRQEQQVSEEQQ